MGATGINVLQATANLGSSGNTCRDKQEHYHSITKPQNEIVFGFHG